MNDDIRKVMDSCAPEDGPLTPELIKELLRKGAKAAQLMHEELERTMRPTEAQMRLRLR